MIWPDRDTLHSTMPDCFKEAFGNRVTVIMDCFEVFIERPNNLKSSALCWSNYKHHLTVKIFIIITPQGSVCFVSDGWGGRTSDKYITENSSEFMKNILPGDLVLADRGFTVEDSLNVIGPSLNIPTFTRGI